MLIHALLEVAEQLINPVLKRDPASLRQLAELDGRVLRIRCFQPDLAVLLWPSSQGIHLEQDQDIDVDAEVRGSREQFVAFLLAGKEQERLLFQGDITLLGDAQLVRRLQGIFTQLDLDWQGLLEKPLGVVPADLLLSPLRQLSQWPKSVLNSSRADWQEYLQEEIALLPGEYEISAQGKGVNQLRQSTDRLEARVQRLQNRIQQLQAEQPSRVTSSVPSQGADNSPASSTE